MNNKHNNDILIMIEQVTSTKHRILKQMVKTNLIGVKKRVQNKITQNKEIKQKFWICYYTKRNEILP